MSFSYFFTNTFIFLFDSIFLCFYVFMYNFTCSFSYFVCICLGIHGAPRPAFPARGVWNYFMYSFICVWKIFLCIPLFIYKMAGTGGSRQKDTVSSSIYLYIMCTSILDVFICNYVYAWRSSFCSAAAGSNIKTCISLCM